MDDSLSVGIDSASFDTCSIFDDIDDWLSVCIVSASVDIFSVAIDEVDGCSCRVGSAEFKCRKTLALTGFVNVRSEDRCIGSRFDFEDIFLRLLPYIVFSISRKIDKCIICH